jgi:1-deoxyxylulose-5-phosphate synthase
MAIQYRRLGSSGAQVSCLALGTDNLLNPTPEPESIAMVLHALDLGINLIDTSNSYAAGGSETVIGKALAESGRRDEAFIATKAFYPTGPGPNDRGGSRAHLIRACEDSLRRLQTDHIDLYQLHRPDFDVPIEETMGALHDLRQQGKIRYAGSSTAPAWRVLEGTLTSRSRGWEGFSTDQPPYNLLDRRIENELVPMASAHGIGLLPWSPLAMGILGGRYANDDIRATGTRAAVRGGIYAERVSPAAVRAGNRFVDMARRAGYDAAQLAIAWVISRPAVTAALIGPKTIEQLTHLAGSADVVVTAELSAACDEINPPGTAVADFHNSAPWMLMHIDSGESEPVS